MIRQGVQALAYQNTLTREGASACAVVVVYLLSLAWLAVVVWQCPTLTVAHEGRVVPGQGPFITGTRMPFLFSRCRLGIAVGRGAGAPVPGAGGRALLVRCLAAA